MAKIQVWMTSTKERGLLWVYKNRNLKNPSLTRHTWTVLRAQDLIRGDEDSARLTPFGEELVARILSRDKPYRPPRMGL